MMIEKAKILSVKGRTKSLVGSGLLLVGEIEDRGVVELLALRRQWPCGVIDPFLIGEEVDVIVGPDGETPLAMLIPFVNQGPNLTSELFTKLLQMANEAGDMRLSDLPIAHRARPSAESQSPHPMAEALNRILRQVPEEVEEDEVL